MKKIVLIGLILWAMALVDGFAQEAVTINGIGYEIEDGVAKLVAVPESITELVVPDQIVAQDGTAYPVVEIAEEASWDQDSLQSLHLGANVKLIGRYAFALCENLKEIVGIPASLEAIDEFAFWDCSLLEKVEFVEVEGRDRNIVLGVGAFQGCSALKSFPLQYVRLIGIACFANCSSIESIPGIDGVEGAGDKAFMYCINLKEAELPSMATILPELFSKCISLERVIISNEVTIISTEAFLGCKNLSDINIPESLEKLGGSAFSGCTSLYTITLPRTLTEMGNVCFDYCENLGTLISLNPEPPSVGSFFEDIYDSPARSEDENLEWYRVVSEGSDCVLYVPEGCVEAYANAPGWMWFKTIKEIPTQGVADAVSNAEEPVAYYDLQGMRVTSPRPGSVVIRRQGSKSEKIRF